MKAYKGFNKDMTCRGFQYEEGKSYHTDKAEICNTGFHACEYPLDCLSYYNPSESVYHEVELDGEIDDDNDDDSKVASTDITIKGKLSIANLVQCAIDFTMKRAKSENDSDKDCGVSSATGDYGVSSATGTCGASSATGDCGVSSATGDYGVSSATGTCGASSATGDCGVSSATGDYGVSSATGTCGASSATGDYGVSSAIGYKGVSSATGDYGASSATGYKGVSSATGTCGVSSATGDYGVSSATGDYGVSSATGTCGASSAENETAVAVAWGYKAKAKGVLGSHLVFADWNYIGNDEYYNSDKSAMWNLNGAKMVQVDGSEIKADTWYTMQNGDIVEVEEDD